MIDTLKSPAEVEHSWIIEHEMSITVKLKMLRKCRLHEMGAADSRLRPRACDVYPFPAVV